MLIVTMTQVGCEYTTQCISLAYADVLHTVLRTQTVMDAIVMDAIVMDWNTNVSLEQLDFGNMHSSSIAFNQLPQSTCLFVCLFAWETGPMIEAWYKLYIPHSPVHARLS